MLNYYTLKNLTNYKITSNELRTVEDIFSWEKNNREGVPVLGFCGPVTNMYLKPNAQYYYFTTMNEFEINQTLLVVNHNNIATPMSRDLDNHKKSTLCRVLKAYDDRYKNKVTLEEGVWIVEHVHVPKERYEWTGKALLFYNRNKYVAGDDIVFRENIANEVRPLIPNLTKDKFIPEANFIVLYFIPKETILKHPDIHIPRFNILITRNNNIEEIRHPDFVDKEPLLKVEFMNHTYVRYEVVKHTLPSPYEFYYVKTGTEVISIKPICTTDKEEGCYKSIVNNGITVSKEFSNLENMGKEFGVYLSADEAKYNGDVNKEIELQKQGLDKQKLEVESERIKFDFAKLKVEYDKLENEKSRIELEYERIKYEEKKLKMDKEKLSIELQKIKLEKRMLNIKLTLTDLDFDKKKFEHYISNHKAMLDYNLYRRKVLTELRKLQLEKDNMITKYNNDKSMAEIKHEYEVRKMGLESISLSHKSNVDNLSKATTAINLTLSTIAALVKAFAVKG